MLIVSTNHYQPCWRSLSLCILITKHAGRNEATKVNYEQQLNVLSEHFEMLTQKISITEDELELIKSFKVIF